MGGKSDAPSPPPAVDPGPGIDMSMMMNMFSQMMASQSAQAPLPTIPEAPEIVKDPEIDFSERTKELAEQVRADYQDEQTRKRGRADTILTSPLLDDELDKTGSLLT